MKEIKNQDWSSLKEILKNNNISDYLLTDIQNNLAGERKKNTIRRAKLPFDYNTFCELLTAEGTLLLEQQHQPKKFTIDQNNEPVIQQFYLYSVLSIEFSGDLHKGILLQGKIGCGKSLLLESYTQMQCRFIHKSGIYAPLTLFIRSTKLYDSIIKDTNQNYLLRPLAIDELGRESKTSMVFGNLTRPLSELLHLRGDNGALTHGTTNFSIDTLSSDEFYGKMVGDRLRLMFNPIIMKGESRRV